MTPFCPYCGIQTTLLQEPNNLPPLHLLSNSSYYWKCIPCDIGIAYAFDTLYVTFPVVIIGKNRFLLQLRSNMSPGMYVYIEDDPGLKEVPIPNALANQITPQNLETKIRTFLTFS